MRRLHRQICSVGFVLVIAGACSAPDRDYGDLGSSGSSGTAGKLSVLSGGRAGGSNIGGAAGEGGVPVDEGGSQGISGSLGSGGLLGSGGSFAAAGAGAGGVPESGGSAGESNAGTGGRIAPGNGGVPGGGAPGGGAPGTGGVLGSGGGIIVDPCATVVCRNPPAATCVDATTARTFGTGQCTGGKCDYPPSDMKCATNQACANGVCSLCASDTQCGPSCTACTSNAPHCKAIGAGSACVQCVTSRDCGGAICDPVSNRCVKSQALLIANQANILKFDATTGESLGVFASVRFLTNASGLALGPNGDLFVSDLGSNAVHEFDGATGAYLASPVSTKGPADVTFGPDGNMYVAVSGGVVVRYTSAGASPLTFVQGPSEIAGLRFNGTDLFVSYAGSPGLLVQYDGKGNKVAEIFNQFAGSGPRAPSFGPDGTLFVPEWQTPYVKAFAAGSYKPLGNFIDDREVSPISVGFAIDGAMLVLSNNTKESSVRRYDPATGAFLSVLVPPGSGGLGVAARMLVLPPI